MLIPFIAAVSSLATAPAPEGEGVTAVRAFVAAYNKRDFAALEGALAADARWYSVEGAKVSVEGEGAAAILGWTRNYLLKSCTSCRSELLSATSSGLFVTTVERAIWTNAAGACVSQSGPAVYELAEGRIKAVWYFPSSGRSGCERRK